MEETTGSQRERRREGSGGTSGETPKWVGIIVIGALVVLAAEAGLLKNFVIH